MKQVKLNTTEFEGYGVTVTLSGDINEYAKSFLHIFNNVRERQELLHVENYDFNNDVTVYCLLESKDALVEYLENFGEIKRCEKVLLYCSVIPDYDYDKYYGAVILPYSE